MKWYVWAIVVVALVLALYGAYGSFRLRKAAVKKGSDGKTNVLVAE